MSSLHVVICLQPAYSSARPNSSVPLPPAQARRTAQLTDGVLMRSIVTVKQRRWPDESAFRAALVDLTGEQMWSERELGALEMFDLDPLSAEKLQVSRARV